MDEINHTQVDLSGEDEDFQEWFQIQIQKALSINSVKCKSFLFLSFEQPIANETNIRIHNIITSHKAFDTSFHTNNSSQEKIIQFLRENIYSLFQKTFDYESIEKMNEKVINKKYIDENVTADDVWSGLLPSIAESTKWLTHFAQQLPGFDKFDLEDFSFLVHGGVLPLHTLKYNKFYRNNENYTILKNNVIYNKKNVNLLFGKNLSDLVFLFFKKARSLNLTEREFALFHPFILLSCDIDLIKSKEYLNDLKQYYVSTLINEFKLNSRDEIFAKNLMDFFKVILVLELNKDEYKFQKKKD